MNRIGRARFMYISIDEPLFPIRTHFPIYLLHTKIDRGHKIIWITVHTHTQERPPVVVRKIVWNKRQKKSSKATKGKEGHKTTVPNAKILLPNSLVPFVACHSFVCCRQRPTILFVSSCNEFDLFFTYPSPL